MLFLALCSLTVLSVTAYPMGPPKANTGNATLTMLHEELCKDMFPYGHGKDAQSVAPPYEFLLSRTTLNEPMKSLEMSGPITVTLRVKDGQTEFPYFEGLIVQARAAHCNSGDKMEAIGTFELYNQSDSFIEVFECFGAKNSIAHKAHEKPTEVKFLWQPPRSEPGNIYFQATVVKNTETFWTNVFSKFVMDGTDTSTTEGEYCKVRSMWKTDTGAASSVSAVTSLIIAAFVTVNAILGFQ